MYVSLLDIWVQPKRFCINTIDPVSEPSVDRGAEIPVRSPSDDLFNLFVILDDLYHYGQVLFFPVNVYSFGINNFQKVKIFRSILIFLNYSCHFQHFLLNFASHSSENCVLLPPPHLSLAMETTFPFALIYNWKREIIENGISPGFFFKLLSI